MTGWKKAAKNKNCIQIGDTNLDFIKWQDPDQAHEKMVNRTKEEIESAGFTQVIRGVTRTWKGQCDSLVDQCWVNNPNRIISHQNELRGSSDHNLITVLVRTKDRCQATQEVSNRMWRNFCPVTFRERIKNIDWGEFYGTDSLDVKNTIFEEKVEQILEDLAPMRTIQIRKNIEIGWMMR